MTDIDYTRQIARPDALAVRNNGTTWDGLTPDPETPTRLWLRVPDTSEGVTKLMEYDWALDSWSDVTPE